MLTATCSYTRDHGWATPLPSHLDSSDTLVLAFGASEFVDDSAPFDALLAAFPLAHHAGCSTAGEIAGRHVHDASVSVAVIRFEHGRLHAANAALDAPDSSAAVGRLLAAQLPSDGLRAVIVLSDGLHANGTALLDGLVPMLPPGVPVFGGLAGDGSRFQRTWVYGGHQGRAGNERADHAALLSRRVRAIGLYGERLAIGIGCDGGWSDFGPERRVTRSEGNVLFELDHRPALDLYKEYLGELASGLPAAALLFPLSVRRHAGGQVLVRTVLSVDEAARSMTFAGDVPEGASARLMRANNEALIRSAERAGAQAVAGLAGTPAQLLLSISCVGRRLVLGERSDEEVEAVFDNAGEAAAHVGFYSYGEIAPLMAGGGSELHNQTMTIAAIGER